MDDFVHRNMPGSMTVISVTRSNFDGGACSMRVPDKNEQHIPQKGGISRESTCMVIQGYLV